MFNTLMGSTDPGFSGPVVESYTYQSATSGTSLEVAVPAGTQEDDLLVAIFCSANTSSGSSYPRPRVSGQGDGGWRMYIKNDSFVTNYHQRVWCKRATSSTSNTTFISSTLTSIMCWCLRISGAYVGHNTMINANTHATFASQSSHIIPAITTTEDNCLILYGLAFQGSDGQPFSVSGGQGTGFTQIEEANTGGTTGLSACWGQQNLLVAGNTGSATVTSSVSDEAGGFQIAIPPSTLSVPEPAPVIEKWTFANTYGSSLTVTAPSGIVADDLLLILWGGDTTTTPSTPSGWSVANTNTYSPVGSEIFYKVAAGTETDVTLTGMGTAYHAAYYLRISGAHTTTPINDSVTHDDTGTNLYIGSTAIGFESTVDNCLAVGIVATDGADAIPYSLNFFNDQTTIIEAVGGGGGSTGVGTVFWHRIKETAGNFGTDDDIDSSVDDQHAVISIFIRPP